MRTFYLVGWAITRPIALFVWNFVAEPILSLNVWLKRKVAEA